MNNRERINIFKKIITEDAMKQRWFPLKNVDSSSFIITAVYPEEGDERDTVLVQMESGTRKLNLLLNFEQDRFLDSINSGEVLPLIEDIISKKFDELKFKGNLKSLKDHMLNFRALNANQSNSSFVLDNAIIGKFMRTYTKIDNPDFVIPMKLWNETSFRNIPEHIGQIEFLEDQCLFTFSRFLPGSTDYWSYLYEKLRGENDRTFILDEASKISEITAGLHNALAGLKGKEFEPEKFTNSDTMGLESSLWEYSEKLKTICADMEKTNPYARIIGTKSSVMDQRIRDVMKILNTGMKKQRIHGDYHLGQILKTDDSPKIIDFEGEPMRSSEYRNAKQMPMKDLAGLIRSFDYLCSSKLGTDNHLGVESKERIIKSYIKERNNLDENSSQNMDQFRTILDIFIMEKAIYEAIYESENRPDWINIPLSYLANFLSR